MFKPEENSFIFPSDELFPYPLWYFCHQHLILNFPFPWKWFLEVFPNLQKHDWFDFTFPFSLVSSWNWFLADLESKLLPSEGRVCKSLVQSKMSPVPIPVISLPAERKPLQPSSYQLSTQATAFWVVLPWGLQAIPDSPATLALLTVAPSLKTWQWAKAASFRLCLTLSYRMTDVVHC